VTLVGWLLRQQGSSRMSKPLFNQSPIYIVDGARTPFLKASRRPGPFSASDLAVSAGKALLARQPFAPEQIDEVILGCMIPSVDEANIARIVALRLGCGKTVPAWTVQRNCASGMQALDAAVQSIRAGRSQLVLAGGTDAMSRAPLLFNHSMVNWLADLAAAKGWSAKLQQLMAFRPGMLKPVVALMHGLTDPTIHLNMGQTAENLAYRFGITRAEMDAFALESQQRAASAQDQHHFPEISTLYDHMGHCYETDNGVRRDSSLEKLAKLKPMFDKPFGNMTAGNSSQVTDGAALLLLASEAAVKQHHLPVLGKIIDTSWVGLDPAEMGLGPVYATAALLKRHQLTLQDINFWEINEAFAAQVLACLAALEQEGLGKVDSAQLNVDGGAIALGHPVGASGARLVLHLAHVLQREKAKFGIATLCIGGGQGGAMLIEQVEGV